MLFLFSSHHDSYMFESQSSTMFVDPIDGGPIPFWGVRSDVWLCSSQKRGMARQIHSQPGVDNNPDLKKYLHRFNL